ncbi:hypothetical protein GCK32_009283, partial [Trichostrongylus colubriformis]
HEKTEGKVVDYYRNHGVCVTVSGDSSVVLSNTIADIMTAMLNKRASG